ncbi:MAG: thiamine pyrophosphate-dependent enzyme, partial [Nocardioidaceae bacterium]
RPEQLPSSLLAAMRVLTDPAETGAVTLSLPQDVQAEAHDWPVELFEERVWHVPRPQPDAESLRRAVDIIRASRRPLLVAGGGVVYSRATGALRDLVEHTGVPVAETQAGKGSLPYDHPQAVGAIGATGSTAANALAAEADVVVGVGTRYSDFTTASRSIFADPDVRFVNLNVAAVDAAKLSAVSLVADARVGLERLREELGDWQVDSGYRDRARDLAGQWDATVQAAYDRRDEPLPAQSAILGVVNEAMGPRDVVVCAAGSMPGDLHKLWRTRDPKGYHVEYGFSCMGYEIAGGLGVKMAAPDREVVVLVGDGSYLMMAQELVTAVQEGVKLVVVIVQNHGFASIGALSESVGSQRFGTAYRYRNPESGLLDGDVLPVDLADNAASLGAHVLRARGIDELRKAMREALDAPDTRVVHVDSDPLIGAPDSQAWWDVPVAEVSGLESTWAARATYDENKRHQRHHWGPQQGPTGQGDQP